MAIRTVKEGFLKVMNQVLKKTMNVYNSALLRMKTRTRKVYCYSETLLKNGWLPTATESEIARWV